MSCSPEPSPHLPGLAVSTASHRSRSALLHGHTHGHAHQRCHAGLGAPPPVAHDYDHMHSCTLHLNSRSLRHCLTHHHHEPSTTAAHDRRSERISARRRTNGVAADGLLSFKSWASSLLGLSAAPNACSPRAGPSTPFPPRGWADQQANPAHSGLWPAREPLPWATSREKQPT